MGLMQDILKTLRIWELAGLGSWPLPEKACDSWAAIFADEALAIPVMPPAHLPSDEALAEAAARAVALSGEAGR